MAVPGKGAEGKAPGKGAKGEGVAISPPGASKGVNSKGAISGAPATPGGSSGTKGSSSGISGRPTVVAAGAVTPPVPKAGREEEAADGDEKPEEGPKDSSAGRKAGSARSAITMSVAGFASKSSTLTSRTHQSRKAMDPSSLYSCTAPHLVPL